MITTSKIKNNTPIKFDILGNGNIMTGKVVGVADTGHPIVGITYIIKPDIPLPLEAWEYDCFVLPACRIVEIG